MNKRMIIAVVALAICFIVASTLSYHDAVDHYEHCMAMIDAGAWPEEMKASC